MERIVGPEYPLLGPNHVFSTSCACSLGPCTAVVPSLLLCSKPWGFPLYSPCFLGSIHQYVLDVWKAVFLNMLYPPLPIGYSGLCVDSQVKNHFLCRDVCSTVFQSHGNCWEFCDVICLFPSMEAFRTDGLGLMLWNATMMGFVVVFFFSLTALDLQWAFLFGNSCRMFWELVF